jgi:hypothetical protein
MVRKPFGTEEWYPPSEAMPDRETPDKEQVAAGRGLVSGGGGTRARDLPHDDAVGGSTLCRSSRPESLDTPLVYAVDVRTCPARLPQDAVPVRDEAAACSSPRSWAFVRQNARTPPAMSASRSAGRRRIASSFIKTTNPRRPTSRSQVSSRSPWPACSPYTSAIVWTTRPDSRSASGTILRPRLRSMKNSGSSAITADYPAGTGRQVVQAAVRVATRITSST